MPTSQSTIRWDTACYCWYNSPDRAIIPLAFFKKLLASKAIINSAVSDIFDMWLCSALWGTHWSSAQVNRVCTESPPHVMVDEFDLMHSAMKTLRWPSQRRHWASMLRLQAIYDQFQIVFRYISSQIAEVVQRRWVCGNHIDNVGDV